MDNVPVWLSAKREALFHEAHKLAFLHYLHRGWTPPRLDKIMTATISDEALWNYTKFNPNHDPSNGQFTFGPGDNGDDSTENNTDNSTTVDKIGRFLRWAFSLVGTAHAQTAEDGSESEPAESEPIAEAVRRAELIDPLSGPRVRAFESALSTLRQLDPNNRELSQLNGPDWVPSWHDVNTINQEIATASYQRAIDFCMPNGEQVGEQGGGNKIRILSGDLSTAEQDFRYLTIGGKALNIPSYRGTMMCLP